MIVNLKKQTNEARRDKERLQIAIKGEQRKTIDVISKRKTLITEESEKIYMDFKQTLFTNGPSVSTHHNHNNFNTGMTLNTQSSRGQLHTPKGLLNQNNR